MPLKPDKAPEEPSMAAAKIANAKTTQGCAVRKKTGRSNASPNILGKAAITCQRETLLIDDYLSSRLSLQTLGDFKRHLKLCPDCHAFLRAYRKTLELTRAFLELESVKTRSRKLALRQRESRG